MSNMVEFKPTQPEFPVYTCQCGVQLWFLTPDGRCICSGCNHAALRLICYDAETHGRQN